MQRQLIRLRSGFRSVGKVEAQLQYWAQQLHDLSGRNRLLYYRDTKASSAIIQDPEFLELFHLLVDKGAQLRVPVPSQAEIARRAQEATLKPPVDDLHELISGPVDNVADSESEGLGPESLQPTPDSPAEQGDAGEKIVERTRSGSRARTGHRSRYPEIATNASVMHLNDVMYNLRYAARTVQEEQGFNILFVTFGMLRWRDVRSVGFSQAPLVLVPIRLEREHPGLPYGIRMADDDIVVNPVLQIKLFKDFGIQFPEVDNDLASAELRAFLGEVRDRIGELDGWGVEEKATVGAFNFLTQLLIKDFENHAALYAQHPLVRRLSGIEPSERIVDAAIPEAQQLDDVVDPADVFQVLDADSSQQEAIEAAKRGLSFVLQGPPGTGKSQTIANLIAESVMAGKRVLFVSQKMAALEVVRERLRRKGLAEFCLEAHSHRMDKRKVIRDLMSSLSDAAVKVRNPEHGMKQKEIREIRDELNSYVRQLHEPRMALGLSLYELYGRLTRYLEEPELDFPLPDIDTISSSELAKKLALIREASGYGELIRQHAESPWRTWNGSDSSLADRERIAASLRLTGEMIDKLDAGICAIARRYSLQPPSTVGEDMQFMQVLSCFKANIFSSGLQGAIGRYKLQALPSGRYFSLQYAGDSQKLNSLYRNRRQLTTQEVAEALTVLSKIVMRGRGDPSEEEAGVNDEAAEFATLQGALEQVQEGCAAVRDFFKDGQPPTFLAHIDEQTSRDAAAWFNDCADHTGELAEWANFNNIRSLAEQRGIGLFLERALEEAIPPESWEGAFSRRFYRLCIERVVRDQPLLQRFKGTTHSELVRRFRALDLATIEMSAGRIKSELSQRKPQWSWLRAESAETSILRREFNKQRGVKPMRKLFSEIPNLIQALKPCLMMSPLTVCQLLDPTIHQFDLAVFDEASQIPPEYAVGAFLRARQVVVAGDSQQLPPMNFFQTTEGDEPDEEYAQDESRFESILTLCDSRGFPSKMLNWHYRSRDESLIAYSNFHFYDNRLYTFPSARREDPATGLKFLFVPDGAYHAGEGARDNPVEARRVAELVHQHLSTSPELSLGIVTFSVPQRRAIEREIDRLRMKNRNLDGWFRYDVQEPLFVKNLENVQGDERDVIILSVGYGRDEAGKIALNFGPLNRDGGARRLNVAVTRARRLVYLVSSMQPEDIDLSRASSTGARLLRSYLETARDGVAALYPIARGNEEKDFETPFEESVFNELTKRGLDVSRNIGVSQYRIELAVKDPDAHERFILGLESDGPMYRSGLTARDRDRLRAQVLEGLGWKMHRIWSRDWIQDRDAEVRKVLELIDQRQEGPQLTPAGVHGGVKGRERAVPAAPVPHAAAPSAAHLPGGAIPYARPELEKPARTGMRAFLEAPLSQLIDELQLLANEEGPVSVSSAKALILRTWETRQGEKVNQRLELALKRGQAQGAYLVNGSFLWASGKQVAPLRVHVAGQPIRKIQEIAPEEIERAIRECVKGSLTIGHEDLVREAGKLFGLKNSPATSAPIDALVQAMLKRDVLRQEAGKVRRGSNF